MGSRAPPRLNKRPTQQVSERKINLPQAGKKIGVPVHYETGLYSRVGGVGGVSDFTGVNDFCEFICVSGVSDFRRL